MISPGAAGATQTTSMDY